jgi:hypothetical protein
MNTPERIKQHQTIQRENPHLTPDQVELLLLGGTLQPEPKPKTQDMTWADGFLMLFLAAIVIFVGILLK